MREPAPTLAALPPVAAVDALPQEALPGFVTRLSALMAAAGARLAASAGNGACQADRMLSVAEAAARTGMSHSWLYRHHSALPFAKRIGRKVVFSEAGLTRWLGTRPR